MKDRKLITKVLSEGLEAYINPKNDPRVYYAREVTFNYGKIGECRVDYMQFVPRNNSTSGIEQGRFYAFEIKSSVEDFHSGHGTNWGIADMNYIVTLPEVYEKIKQALPHWVGCVIPYGNSMKVIKRAKQCDRDKSNSEMLLMMFRSANRENIRRRKREG